MNKRWWWVAVGAVVVAACAARGGDNSPDEPAARKPSATPSVPKATARPSTAIATPTGIPSDWYRNYDPAQFSVQVRKSADRAGISAQLLMAILYNEDYKPHDPSLERSWQHIKPGAAFGIANMHRAAFDEAKRGRFGKRQWEELPDHPELAIEAAAWHLHDLAGRLASRRGKYSKDELLAMGYNSGAGNMRAFATGSRPGAQVRSYLDTLHENWDKAAKAVKS